VHAEGFYGGTVAELRQSAVMQERGGNVIGDAFVVRQVGRTLAGDDSGELVVGQPSFFAGDDVGVKLIG
jgi:hypothetical protein